MLLDVSDYRITCTQDLSLSMEDMELDTCHGHGLTVHTTVHDTQWLTGRPQRILRHCHAVTPTISYIS